MLSLALHGCRSRRSLFVGRSSLPRHRAVRSCTATLQQGLQRLCSCQPESLPQLQPSVLMHSSLEQVSLFVKPCFFLQKHPHPADFTLRLFLGSQVKEKRGNPLSCSNLTGGCASDGDAGAHSQSWVQA